MMSISLGTWSDLLLKTGFLNYADFYTFCLRERLAEVVSSVLQSCLRDKLRSVISFSTSHSTL